MEIDKIIGEVDFNYDDDKREFNRGDRIVRLNHLIDEDKQDSVAITFELGRKEDDGITLLLPRTALLQKLRSLELLKE